MECFEENKQLINPIGIIQILATNVNVTPNNELINFGTLGKILKNELKTIIIKKRMMQ